MLRDSGLEDLNDSDIEALQTDVMRFIAILAFCLLIIFIPLVRSIPEHVDRQPPAIVEENQELKQELHRLKEATQRQAKEMQALTSQLHNQQEQATRAAALVVSLQERDQEIERLRQGLQSRQVETEDLKRSLRDLNGKLDHTEAQLAAVRQAAVSSPPPPVTPPPPEATPPPQTVEPPPPPAEATPPPPTKQAEPEAPPQDVEPKSPPQSEILFASQDALLHLVRAGEVGVLLQTEGAVFEIYMRRGQMTYRKVHSLSGQLYTMPDSLVPRVIQEATRTYLSNVLGQQRHYYLKLAPRIQRDLVSTMTARQTGKFIITKEGNVRYESFP